MGLRGLCHFGGYIMGDNNQNVELLNFCKINSALISGNMKKQTQKSKYERCFSFLWGQCSTR